MLPPNVYDVDKILSETPLLRTNNAFHDTLNSEYGGDLEREGEERTDAAVCVHTLTRSFFVYELLTFMQCA